MIAHLDARARPDEKNRSGHQHFEAWMHAGTAVGGNMRKQLWQGGVGAVAALVLLTAGEHAEAFSQDHITGPALFARYTNYTAPPWANPDQGGFSPTCNNDPSSMPSGRQSDCNTNTHQVISTGVYQIKVTNGAPLPASGGDAGWSLLISPVGSNARCAETATTWISNELISTIKCVNPSGTAVDTQFVWVYRTDSTAHMQFNTYPLDFAYARVNRGSGNQVVSSQTFSPFTGAITSQRLATGQFRVTFQGMNLANSFGFTEPTTGMNNVVVQRTCMNDTSSDCLRAVCVPTAWSFGSQSTDNTTVDVQCHLGGTAVNVDFRVFIGNQALTSQMMGGSWSGGHYGWAKSPGFGPNITCKQTNEFTHRNQHETPDSDYPTLPATACRSGTGAYRVEFDAQGFYSINRASPLTTSRSVGAYCNVDYVLCGGQQCSPEAQVGVRCYDNTTGNAKDALWNLSLTY